MDQDEATVTGNREAEGQADGDDDPAELLRSAARFRMVGRLLRWACWAALLVLLVLYAFALRHASGSSFVMSTS